MGGGRQQATARGGLRLLCLSMAGSGGAGARRARRGCGVRAGGFEDAEQAAGEVALEAALDLAWGFALGEAPRGVGAGGGVVLEAGERDGMQRAVELAVAGAVESVADRLARGGGDGCRAGEHGKRAVVAQPAVVRPGAVELGGADRADAGLGQQLGNGALDDLLDLV